MPYNSARMHRILHSHGFFLLMVVSQFNIKRIISLKPENNAPIGAHRYRP
jgi:hypothetical protein